MKEYIELTKPRITWLILMSTGIGFFFGVRDGWSWLVLLHTIVGTGLIASGTAALNQWMERDADAQDAPDEEAAAAFRPDYFREGLLVCGGAVFCGVYGIVAGRQSPDGSTGRIHTLELPVCLYSSEADHSALDYGGGDPRGDASCDGVRRGARGIDVGSARAFCDFVSVAVPPLLCDCLALSGRLRPRGHSDAAGCGRRGRAHGSADSVYRAAADSGESGADVAGDDRGIFI